MEGQEPRATIGLSTGRKKSCLAQAIDTIPPQTNHPLIFSLLSFVGELS